ncbi:ricin B-like lectin EULS3 isoform X2 [Ziziphus jujuba]|uniref:Ricin B-like lectin EULS3 isoform X2 n=1 Tax=Ziziphus jujuba TaxID=326968 RepID=A0ABM4A4X7_ZIZJJ|nr:ricin B-like lectin EULS3 isoform X2 [Ziziphus jujuba]
MEFPYGHHSHTHHQRRGEDEEYGERPNYPPRPPPSEIGMGSTFDQPLPPPRPSYFAQNEEFPPAPPHSQPAHVTHISHAHVVQGQQDFNNFSANFPPHKQPPPLDSSDCHSAGGAAVGVHHVAHHDLGQNPLLETHFPSSVHHQTHQSIPSNLSDKPTVKVFSKARPDFSLTIRDGKVILAPSDPSDVFQHWYKDEKYSTRVKDEVGFPSFALINKATGQAIKHSIGASHPHDPTTRWAFPIKLLLWDIYDWFL